MDFQDWYFENIEELVSAVDNEEFDLDNIFIEDINRHIYLGLKERYTKPQFGNKEHIKIVKFERLQYLKEKYIEFWFSKPIKEILGRGFTGIPRCKEISYEELTNFYDCEPFNQL